MARGSVSVRSIEGGIGARGPAGVAQWAAVGVASGAQAIADQEPVIVTSPSDAEAQIGIGPLRDLLVSVLHTTGGAVLVMPLRRSSGGEVVDATQTMGQLAVTAVGGYALGQQHVRLECVTGGAAPTAVFRLIVDGVPQATFSPTAAQIANAIVLTPAQLGSLATGVPTANYFAPTITSATFVAGEFVEFQMQEPKATGSDFTAAVNRLEQHRRLWEWVAAAGTVSGASIALLNTAVRGLEATGRYVFAIANTIGRDAQSGGPAVAITTAAWVTGIVGGITGAPAYQDSPRLQIGTNHDVWDDPISGQEKIWPGTYGYVERLAKRQPWEASDAPVYGAKGTVEPRGATNCKSIYPVDLTGEQIDLLDDTGYLTSQYHDGEEGVFVTHDRMWGQPAAPGVTATDYQYATRRRVMDEFCRRARRAIRPYLNLANIATDAAGRMAPSAIAQREGVINGALSSLIPQAASAARATVTDEDPGILASETLLVTIDVRPLGKSTSIRTTLAFRASVGATEAA